jgi:hypothetical protein
VRCRLCNQGFPALQPQELKQLVEQGSHGLIAKGAKGLAVFPLLAQRASLHGCELTVTGHGRQCYSGKSLVSGGDGAWLRLAHAIAAIGNHLIAPPHWHWRQRRLRQL